MSENIYLRWRGLLERCPTQFSFDEARRQTRSDDNVLINFQKMLTAFVAEQRRRRKRKQREGGDGGKKKKKRIIWKT